jgi:hypothetical protein
MNNNNNNNNEMNNNNNNNNEMNNNNEYDYRQYLFNDCESIEDDSDSDIDSIIDTEWITDIENQIINDEYQLFMKTDITRIKFEFLYLDHDKKCVERMTRMTYPLNHVNHITKNELFSVIQSHQKLDKKYYNFQSLLLYQFNFQYKDIIRDLSEYLKNTSDEIQHEKVFIEYTNLHSIDVIYFTPLISMFHDFIGFSVLLYED